MESDRELLELAAKAAGYDVVWNDNWKAFQHKAPVPDAYGMMRHPWVPLDDDGDALRLAVKLDLDLFQAVTYKEVQVVGALQRTIFESWGDDKFSATRRAVVRAAAEIGRRMKDADKERKENALDSRKVP